MEKTELYKKKGDEVTRRGTIAYNYDNLVGSGTYYSSGYTSEALWKDVEDESIDYETFVKSLPNESFL